MGPGGGFEVVAVRRVADLGFLGLDEVEVEAPDGRRATRVAVRHPGAVAVLPVIDGEVVLIRQYRAPIDSLLLEIPAGKLDVTGEPLEVTAARELEEEIGYRAEELSMIADMWTTPGFSDERIRIYVAEGMTPVPTRPHGIEEEAAELVRVPVGEVADLLASGAVGDAKTLVALQWLVAREQ
jgi:ADP-ribose pyrophosphatase